MFRHILIFKEKQQTSVINIKPTTDQISKPIQSIKPIQPTQSDDIQNGMNIITTIMYSTICIGSLVAVIIIIVAFA